VVLEALGQGVLDFDADPPDQPLRSIFPEAYEWGVAVTTILFFLCFVAGVGVALLMFLLLLPPRCEHEWRPAMRQMAQVSEQESRSARRPVKVCELCWLEVAVTNAEFESGFGRVPW